MGRRRGPEGVRGPLGRHLGQRLRRRARPRGERAHRGRDGAGRAPCPAPRRQPLHRAPGHLRGRVPPAAARAGRPRRRLDQRHGRGRRELHGRARPARRDRGLRGARGGLPAPAEPRPRDVRRSRQGRRHPRDRPGDRRRHRHLRRRARAQPAEEPRGPAQGQGRRPDRADPRHLRPARQVARGHGADRAGPAQLHEAAPARLGRPALPPGRWPGRCRGRRHRWPWSR